jgi:ATP-dependent Clp protease ATP-binding subunit ClpA
MLSMPKINVYLPDDLAEAVRTSGLPVSAICQRALEEAVRRITVIRRTELGSLDADQLQAQLPAFTGRAVVVLSLAINAAREAGAPNVSTGHLLRAMINEGGNLALRVLTAMDINPQELTWPERDEPGGGDGLRYSTPAAGALEMPIAEATALGHNYVGCEHLLIGLAAEPDGIAGKVLREAGADAKAVRRAVAAATSGYAHLRASKPPVGPDQLLSLVRQELSPLVQRIEALESRPSS